MKVRVWRAFALAVLYAGGLQGYSVLTHEAIIDTAWKTSLQPLIVRRFPAITPDELIDAHAYAYGGAILQDMGYYPFGSKFFSDLVHYVRSGDFILALLSESQDSNEYAFALGALAHYAADNQGHSIATNRVVPMLYPKLKAKYGPEVTYEDNPGAHLKTEFGFDVIQVAQGNYAPKAYHDFIGFKVSKAVLERAFARTYSVQLKDVLRTEDLALGTFRHSVSAVIPEMTKAAWQVKKDDITRAAPGTTRRKFLYNLSRASYEKEWGEQYDKPGIGAKFLAFLFHLIPKVGPFRALSFRALTPEAEKLFMASFNAALTDYTKYLREVDSGTLKLPNDNFDTGKPTPEGGYRLADETYSKLLEKLDSKHDDVSPELRRNIIAFYRDPGMIVSPKARQEFELLRTAE